MSATQTAEKIETATDKLTLQDLFSASQARLDNWRSLFRAAQVLANTTEQKNRPEIEDRLKDLKATEEYWGYPGPRLFSELEALLSADDLGAFANAVNKIGGALVTNAYRHDKKCWDLHSEAETFVDDALQPGAGGTAATKPYFEILIVTSSARQIWPELAANVRKLRRPTDEFVYEPVIVGTFEDAVLASIVNYNVQSVVIYDGFQYKSHHTEPHLRKRLTAFLGMSVEQLSTADADLGIPVAKAIKQIRPELDIFLLSDRKVEEVAASDGAAGIRRVFYAVEELLEVHLSIMEGIKDRYQTPYFDNLKKYAQRPIGTFHALPIARGKSIFKSNWIRDMGEFYGANLFLAESSATTGGLDSLLEPTGNIKVAQELAARAFGADKSFFVTNGTSTANKIVGQAILQPGDIVLIDRDCHKSHHYGCVLAGAQPYYIDAFPLRQYSMYGSVPIRKLKEALLKLKAEGRLDKAKMLILTNATFDGHMANVRQTMEELLAIKPDLVFLWDEAWSAFAHFSPFLRRRTAMGGVQHLRSIKNDPEFKKRYEENKKEIGEIDIKNPRALEGRLLPDPEKMRIRVYQTTSVHKSMSCLRQGSIVLVADQDFHDIEEAFHESFFTHTSTSPNLQIIASLDVARRQMELEGYELVMKAIQLSIELRRDVNEHPLISKYFRILSPAEIIPKEFRRSGIEDYGTSEGRWYKAIEAIENDEFFLDPTRVTVLCGTAGFDGSQFKALLSNEHDIQINKTSRNSVLVQININNTRSDLAHLVKALADISRSIDKRLESEGPGARKELAERVKNLIDDAPDLPDFSAFHDAFRDNAKGTTAHGHMREAFYMAYDHEKSEHVRLNGKEIDERLEKGPPLVSANFVIPYPPGFPIMVPGQLITKEIITFMRKLDVKEIHGYQASLGLKVIKQSALEALKQSRK